MTTQAEDLAKALDAHATAVVAASIHIHTGLSQIAEALGYRNPAGRRQDAPGQPRMPGARETPAEPLRGAQDATQPGTDMTAVVVQDNENDLWGRHGAEFTLLGDVAGAGSVFAADQLEEDYGPLTVILDANGNPAEPQWSDVLATAANPAAVRQLIDRAETAEHKLQALTEPDWLDADELNQLPSRAVTIEHGEDAHPRWRNEIGEWCLFGNKSGLEPHQIAPARVLWTPEANR